MAESDEDRLLNLPEVVFSKIFRHLDLPAQRAVYRAYRENTDATGLEYVKAHKMSASCWICMVQIYHDMFCENGGYKHPLWIDKFSKEPALNSEGFEILFKFAGEREANKYFVQRKLWDLKDMEHADSIFYKFQERIKRVFKARDTASLKAHLRNQHRADFYMPKGFFKDLLDEKGQLILIVVLLNNYFYFIYIL